MPSRSMFVSSLAIVLVAFVLGFVLTGPGWSHCDTMGGPVIADARIALERSDVTPVLKWVKPESEAEIRAAFAKTLSVRALGAEARELADRYFFETLVRIHRAGEGAPYTGLKDAPVEPIVAMADRAIAEGSDRAMIEAIAGHMTEAIGEKFRAVLEASKRKDASVEAGREYVEAYVIFMHYVEGIHAAIASAGAHAHAEGQ